MKWPQRYSDWLAIGFFLTLIVNLFVFELAVVLPHYGDRCRWASAHRVVAIYLLVNVLLGLYLLYKTDTSTLATVMPGTLLPGWRYCCLCEANSPPRSFHCTTCNRCILRRDHHCPFSACCIGYKNHKYYMSLLFQVCFGTLYASVFHFEFIFTSMGGLNPFTFFAHFLPIPFFMFRVIDFWTAYCNFLSLTSLIGFLFATGLFAFHWILLLNNQTSFEKNREITEYNLKNWQLNLRETLGNRWLLTIFVSPWIESRLPRDGLQFPTRHEHKHSC